MSNSASKSLFISHIWTHNQQYWNKVVGWFESESGFSWVNCSSPELSNLSDTSTQSLKKEMSRQISTAQAVIILSDMYAANGAWIDYEINESKRMNKFIIGVAPLERGSAPKRIQDSVDLMVSGSSSSLLSMIKLMV